ncbi:MAG: M81 family metallopeptidase [Candidatus Hodarchaeota archaeon]
MRIAIGAMVHETNTFTKYITFFDHFWVANGDEIYWESKQKALRLQSREKCCITR